MSLFYGLGIPVSTWNYFSSIFLLYYSKCSFLVLHNSFISLYSPSPLLKGVSKEKRRFETPLIVHRSFSRLLLKRFQRRRKGFFSIRIVTFRFGGCVIDGIGSQFGSEFEANKWTIVTCIWMAMEKSLLAMMVVVCSGTVFGWAWWYSVQEETRQYMSMIYTDTYECIRTY